MAKTKREYILASCFLSGAAAIISFVALGTQAWVTSKAEVGGDSSAEITSGLFSGSFSQTQPAPGTYVLSTVCAFDLNICALLCGDNAEDNLRKIHNGEVLPDNVDAECLDSTRALKAQRAGNTSDLIFINAGIWVCTILFLIVSAVVGLFACALAVWNTTSSPYQVYFSIFGLYIYNGVACGCILLAIILWGAMFAQDLSQNIPTYKTFAEGYTTDGYAQLGYSFWINLVSLFFYLMSIGLLYLRSFLISKEPKVNIDLEDNADPVIYLY